MIDPLKHLFADLNRQIDEAAKPVVRTHIPESVQQPLGPRLVTADTVYTRIDLPESAGSVLLSEKRHRELLRAEREAEENVGLRFALQTIVTLVERPFPHPQFDAKADEADRYRAIRSHLENAGLLDPEPAFHFDDNQTVCDLGEDE